jgi:dTDP-4-amino-4,6-dideoxygalactose transaminase
VTQAADEGSGQDDLGTGAAGFPGWPHFEPDEISAVSRVLESGKVNYWTGQEAREFENEFAAYTGARHAIALANGTVALELALRSLGVGPGDEVVTTPRSFIASASSAVMCGARVRFADVDRDSQNIYADSIARALTPRTRAVVVVHLAGWPCEMADIMDLARQRDLFVIEDCAQACGARYRARPVGQWAHAAGFSFCQDKIITTGGEGGMLTLADSVAWSRAWSFKDHGKSFEAVYHRQHAPGFRWLHESFGTNWRMTEMQAAIGRAQLRKLVGWVDVRRRNAGILLDRLAGLTCIRVPVPPAHVDHAFYRFYAFVEPTALRATWSRDRLIAEISAAGVPCFAGTCSEIYLEKAFDGYFQERIRLPVASELADTSIALLTHPTLSADDMTRMGELVRAVLLRASW